MIGSATEKWSSYGKRKFKPPKKQSQQQPTSNNDGGIEANSHIQIEIEGRDISSISNTENAKVMNYDVKLLELDPDETQGCDARSMSSAVQVVSNFKLWTC